MAPWDISKAKNEKQVSVKYIGDPANKGEGPEVLESWGFTFVKGESIEVPESLAARLAKSAHFEVVDRPRRGRRPRTETDAAMQDSHDDAESEQP